MRSCYEWKVADAMHITSSAARGELKGHVAMRAPGWPSSSAQLRHVAAYTRARTDVCNHGDSRPQNRVRHSSRQESKHIWLLAIKKNKINVSRVVERQPCDEWDTCAHIPGCYVKELWSWTYVCGNRCFNGLFTNMYIYLWIVKQPHNYRYLFLKLRLRAKDPLRYLNKPHSLTALLGRDPESLCCLFGGSCNLPHTRWALLPAHICWRYPAYCYMADPENGRISARIVCVKCISTGEWWTAASMSENNFGVDFSPRFIRRANTVISGL